MQSYLDIAKQALQLHKSQTPNNETVFESYEFNEFNEVVGKRPLGDGQAPPLVRPPETEQELRRLIDHLADPENFNRWLAWAMNRTDPAEE